MQRARTIRRTVLVGLLATSLGAAPAPPSYYAVLKKMDAIQGGWKELTPDQHPTMSSWSRLFDAIRGELQRYRTSADPQQRVEALNKLHHMSQSLDGTRWAPAAAVREELRSWLKPRVGLAWAEYRMLEAIAAIPPEQAEKREGWRSYIDTKLRPALHEVERADTVANRLKAMDRVDEALAALNKANAPRTWTPTQPLQGALSDLFSHPNVEVTIDRSVVTNAVMKRGLVEPGWIYFKNQWSYVTPGPITNIGFVPTADGIQIVVSQAMRSVTNIQGFQEQIAADPQGKRAAKMYQFDASTQNDAVLSMNFLFRLSSGLQLAPSYLHGISAAIGTTPQSGGGLQRAIAGLLGYNQRRITQEVYDNAMPRLRQEVVAGARELSGIRTSESAANANAQIRQFVRDDRTVGKGDFGMTGVQLQTQPDYATIQGTVVNFAAPKQRGATSAQPLEFQTYQPGVTVDVHLPSAISNVISGYLQGGPAKDVTNIMLVTTKQPDTNRQDVQTTRNADWPTFLAAVKGSSNATGGATQAVRVFKPTEPLQVSSDAAGNLVLLARDFTIEVPAPPQAANGGAVLGPKAKVYRLKMAQAEISLAFEVQPDPAGGPARLVGKVAGFDPGTSVTVTAIDEDETKGTTMNAFTSRIIASAFGTRVTGLPLDVPLDRLAGSPVALTSASKLDPSGWMRLILAPR